MICIWKKVLLENGTTAKGMKERNVPCINCDGKGGCSKFFAVGKVENEGRS